jgi:protein-tyrosine kinase
MENIRQAIERAKARRRIGSRQGQSGRDDLPRPSEFASAPGHEFGAPPPYEPATSLRAIKLKNAVLQSNRIIAHGANNPFSRPFDMLRTQILQAMDAKGHKILAVTSPTPSCGKTVTSLNLALSIARQPERSVLLVDLDLRKPRVASYLGLEFTNDVQTMLEGQSNLSETIIQAHINNQQLKILPTAPRSELSELLASRAMTTMFEEFRREYASETIIVDLPPILSSDDFISILPHVDCVLLVVAVGTSKLSDIEESKKHLQTAEIVRIVVNKAPESSAPYYGYY